MDEIEKVFAITNTQKEEIANYIQPGSRGDIISETYAADINSTAQFVVGIMAVIMIIYSGIQYSMAAGDAGKLAKAKNSLIWSIVGLVVAVLAYAIISFAVGVVK